MNQISKYLAGIALSLAVSAAHSAVISLSPASSSAAPGSTVSLALVVDFGTESSPGGAIDITFAGVLSYDPLHFFVFNPAFQHDPPPFEVKAAVSPSLLTIGFSNFFQPMTGAFTIGQLLVKVAPGAQKNDTGSVTLADSQQFGGFYGLTSPVQYTGATVTAIPTMAAVPEPASVLLFASGLAMLGMVRLGRRAGLA